MTNPTTPNPSSNIIVQELVPVLAPALAQALLPKLRAEILRLIPVVVAETFQQVYDSTRDDSETNDGAADDKTVSNAEKRSNVGLVVDRNTVVPDDEILRRARVLETRHIEEEDGTTIEIESDGTYGGWKELGAGDKGGDSAGNDDGAG